MRSMCSFAAVALATLALSACGSKPTPSESASESSSSVTPEPTDVKIDFASLKGDAAAGEQAFVQCKACHSTEAGKNMVGPSLRGIQGRKAGTVEGYNYSTANKNSGMIWTNEHMFTFLESPQKAMPGTKMAFGGIADAQRRADLVAYLDTLK